MADDSGQVQFERLRPDRVESPDFLDDFLDRFERDVVRQPTHESVKLAFDPDRSSIEGWVSHPQTKIALERLLEKIPLRNLAAEVAVLPTTSSDPLFFENGPTEVKGLFSPKEESPVVHIWSAGAKILPLYTKQGFQLCRSDTGYLGWVRDSELDLAGPAVPSTTSSRTADDWIERTRRWLGVPYVWGGTSLVGTDCSGFVQTLYKEIGILLPRDAHQQMLGGELIATHEHRGPLEPGDLLFFTLDNGRVGHVAISLGGFRVIHAERPALCEFSLDPDDPAFNPIRHSHFVCAKRYSIWRSSEGP